MDNIDILVIAWIALSTCAYFVAIVWVAPKLSARRWREHFEEEDEAQTSLIKILMGKNDDGVIPIIVQACGEVVTENLKKTMQGYQGKSMQMLEKAFDPEGVVKINKELDEYPFYVRLILNKVLDKYGHVLGPTPTDLAPIVESLGLDKP